MKGWFEMGVFSVHVVHDVNQRLKSFSLRGEIAVVTGTPENQSKAKSLVWKMIEIKNYRLNRD